MLKSNVDRICLVIPTEHTFVREVLQGALLRLRAAGCPAFHVPALEALGKCPAWISGFIVDLAFAPWIDRLRRLRRPVVNVSTHLPPAPFASVVTDNRAIGRLAAEHFLERGHDHFGYLGMRGAFFSQKRQAAFAEVVAGKGLPCEQILPDEVSPGGEKKLLRRWLQEVPKPAAVLAANDTRAVDLLRTCEDLRISVPGEVAVLGVGNDEVRCELTDPPLSSVDQNAKQIGYQAASLLLRLIAGQKPPKAPLLVAPRYVAIRESSGAAAVDHQELGPVLQFIWQHAGELQSVKELLRQFPISRRRLELLFHEHVGRSPAKEILRARVEHAKSLLAETDETLKAITAALGFRTFCHFAYVFRRQTGTSPAEYRRQNRFR
jgi:LacI family transcriptional regulator